MMNFGMKFRFSIPTIKLFQVQSTFNSTDFQNKDNNLMEWNETMKVHVGRGLSMLLIR